MGELQIETGITWTGLAIAVCFGLYLFRLIRSDQSMDAREAIKTAEREAANECNRKFTAYCEAFRMGFLDGQARYKDDEENG